MSDTMTVFSPSAFKVAKRVTTGNLVKTVAFPFPTRLKLSELAIKAMLHEAIFLATRIATNVALQVARKNARVTPHFSTAIVALRVARKVEPPSTFRNVARQVASV